MKKFISKLREKKGFTLVELLIVVAIIAVLVAIAIPIFTSQLERSRDSVTASNLRAAYAEAMADMISNGSSSSTQEVVCKGTSAENNGDLSGEGKDLPFGGNALSTIAGYTAEQTVNVKFTVEADDTVKAEVVNTTGDDDTP